MHWIRIGRTLLARFLPLAMIGAVCVPASAQMFMRVTNELRFAQIDAAAIVWFDYDNDGWADVLCGGGWYRGYGNRLFHNNQNGTFTQVSESNFPGQGDHTSWATVADFDDNGLLDVISGQGFTTTGSDFTQESPILYLNQGSGRFTETLLNSSVFGGIDVRAHAIAALDYDGNGFADVAMGRMDVPTKGYLLRNTGERVFSVVTNTAWTLQGAAHETISSVDYDGDRRPDLWGAGASRSLPFTNAANGNYLLEATSLLHNFQVGQTSISSAWGDYDNDGDLDVAINYVNAAPTDLQLFLNDGSGGFTLGGFSAAVLSQYVYCADYDNDGLLDLYATGFNSRSRLYRNLGGGAFTEVLTEPIAQDVFNQWPQAGWGDYNNDGFIDLLVGARNSWNMLYRNTPNGNHWLKVKLVGQASNRAAVGAVVRVTANIGGQDVSQMRVVQAQSSITEMISHFGLGDATNVTTLRIEWPSGIVQELQNVPANQFLTVVESQGYTGTPPQFSGGAKTSSGAELSFTEPAPGARYVIQASTNLVTWTKLAARTSAGVATNYIDTRATNYSRRFYQIHVP